MTRQDQKAVVLMLDVLCGCIETGLMPTHGSPAHRLARKMVDKSGYKFTRKRRPLPRLKAKI